MDEMNIREQFTKLQLLDSYKQGIYELIMNMDKGRHKYLLYIPHIYFSAKVCMYKSVFLWLIGYITVFHGPYIRIYLLTFAELTSDCHFPTAIKWPVGFKSTPIWYQSQIGFIVYSLGVTTLYSTWWSLLITGSNQLLQTCLSKSHIE